MAKVKQILVILSYLNFFSGYGLTLDRVILASDKNPTYLDFWPLVATAWQRFVYVRPTLALIATDDVVIDQSFGDVIRLAPIPDIPNWFYAQVVRLLLPVYFTDDVCITSDMDMLPIKGSYFIDSVQSLSKDSFVVYRDGSGDTGRYPICYIAARGSVFKEIFQINSPLDIPEIVTSWYHRGFGWDTDEVLLREYVVAWHAKTGKCIKLGHNAAGRIDRSNWRYNPAELKAGKYIEAHMVRPYAWHKDKIDKLAKELGLTT